MLITNMDMIFENTVTKLVQMAHTVAQMAKNLCCIELPQNWHGDYFKHADHKFAQKERSPLVSGGKAHGKFYGQRPISISFGSVIPVNC